MSNQVSEEDVKWSDEWKAEYWWYFCPL